MTALPAPPDLRGATYLLPPEAYLDARWLAREQEAVFEAGWLLVAAEDDLPAVGDVLDVQVGRYPIVLARAADGLRAYHNMCRHRGMALVCEGGSAGERLRCPYHGWEFSVDDGSLARIPQRAAQFPDVDVEEWGLIPASVGTWEGLVFVHPHAHAPSFTDHVAGFDEGVGSFRPGLLPQVARVDIEGEFNWKLFVENHVDVYHLWYLHSTTLDAFDHTRFQHRMLGPNWVSYEPMREARRAGVGEGGIEHLTDRDRFGIGAHLLFPNATMASTADYFATYAVFPIGPTRSRVELRIRAEHPARADELLADARAFIDEDVHACEQVQAAIGSPTFEVGPLAEGHEAAITRFQREILARVGTPVAAPTTRGAR